MRVSILYAALLAATCAKPTPSPDAGPLADRDGPGTELGAACAKLRALGCPEGSPTDGRTCFESLERANRIALVPASCIAAASDVAAVKACGNPTLNTTVRCVP